MKHIKHQEYCSPIGLKVPNIHLPADATPPHPPWLHKHSLAVGALGGAVVSLVLSVLILTDWFQTYNLRASQEIIKKIGLEGVVLFKRHDRNNDGVLSLEEFRPIARQLINASNVSHNYNINLKYIS